MYPDFVVESEQIVSIYGAAHKFSNLVCYRL